MSDETNEVMIEAAPDPYTAEVIVGFLKDAGIPAYVRGQELEDPVATAERTMHTMGCQIFVPTDRRAEALEIIEECRREGRLSGSEGSPLED